MGVLLLRLFSRFATDSPYYPLLVMMACRRACRRGIPDTANTGYAGRLTSYGVLPMTDEIRSVKSRVSADEIRKRSNRWGNGDASRKRALEGPRRVDHDRGSAPRDGLGNPLSC